MTVPFNDLSRALSAESSFLLNAMASVVASGRCVLGAEVEQFEAEFATYLGTRSVIGVANGTDALELALRAVGVGPGSRVLTCANAGFYASTAIHVLGAQPVYVDIDPSTLLMDPEALERAGPQSAIALVLTHLYGRMADVPRVRSWCREHGLRLIEDCAQAHGAAADWGRAGAHGDIGCFSFYPTKNLGALGDGGALSTSDDGLAKRARRLRQYGWDRKYEVSLRGGRNSRLDELQAAVLRKRLSSLDHNNARRREIASRYSKQIVNPAIVCPAPASFASEAHVAHLYVVRTSRRDDLRDYLAKHGIGCDAHYPVPDHLQPAYLETEAKCRLPATERACAEVLSLPCFPELRDDEVDAVVTVCNDWKPQ